MNILILGSGGREHALAWAVQQNPKCDRLWMAPGNPGMAALHSLERPTTCKFGWCKLVVLGRGNSVVVPT